MGTCGLSHSVYWHALSLRSQFWVIVTTLTLSSLQVVTTDSSHKDCADIQRGIAIVVFPEKVECDGVKVQFVEGTFF